MGNSIFNRILTILRNLFGHGNLESINSDFDLLTEKGEMAVVVKKEAQAENSNVNAQQDNSHQIFNSEIEYEFDDETLKRIYQTIGEIEAFKERSNKLRHIKFAKRDKVV